MTETLRSGEANVTQLRQDLFLMAFKYHSPELERSGKPYSVYWVLMTDAVTGSLDGLECFADEQGLDLLQPLAITRVAQVADMNEFREVVNDAQMPTIGGIYTHDHVTRRASQGPRDNGQPWITGVFDELSGSDQAGNMLAAGSLRYSELIFYFAIEFTREAMAREKEDDDSAAVPGMDLLTESKFLEVILCIQ